MPKMINSRRKGAQGERDLAKALRSYGYDCRRGQQYCGANGAADVIGLPGVHIECKRVEKLNIESALAQAKADRNQNEIPVVMHKRNKSEWLVTLPLEYFMQIYSAWDTDNFLKDCGY